MKAFVPEAEKSKRVNNPVVSCRLDDDLIDQFYALCAKTGLSPSRLANQMFRFSLENLKQ